MLKKQAFLLENNLEISFPNAQHIAWKRNRALPVSRRTLNTATLVLRKIVVRVFCVVGLHKFLDNQHSSQQRLRPMHPLLTRISHWACTYLCVVLVSFSRPQVAWSSQCHFAKRNCDFFDLSDSRIHKVTPWILFRNPRKATMVREFGNRLCCQVIRATHSNESLECRFTTS